MDAVTRLMEPVRTIFEKVGNSFFNTGFLTAIIVVCLVLAFDIWRKGWRASLSYRMISGSFASIAIRTLNLVFVPLVFIFVDWLQWAYDAFSIPTIPPEFWSGVPFYIAGLLAIILVDFVDYWNHRAMHWKWLWPIHAIHHSDEEVNGFTTFRIHFLEALFMRMTYIFFVSWAGFSPEAAVFGAGVLLLHNVYVHADLDWDHGPFKFLLASPRFHRWHHADDARAYGKNLANVIPLWDRMFGTYFNPGACTSAMGAKGVPHADVVGLMLFPFTEWTKMIALKLRRTENASTEKLVSNPN